MTSAVREEGVSRANLRGLLPKWNETNFMIVLFLLPTLLFMSVFVVWPIINSFQLSLYEWNGISASRDYIGTNNWSRLIDDEIFFKAFSNNLRVVVLSIAIQMPLGMILAIILEVGGRFFIFRIYKTVYFFPMLMSSVAIGILFKYVYDPVFGLVNPALEAAGLENWTHSWLGEPETALYAVIGVICWQFTPFYMVLFLAALSGVPEELREAALIDGANEGRYYLRIALPLVKGTVRTAITLSLIGSLRYFDLIWVMTEGGPNHASELMATFMYKRAFPSFEVGYGSTIASALFMIVMTLALVVFTLTRRYETEV
jgi:raffinose/stachyose/melibiose transport system permease protein